MLLATLVHRRIIDQLASAMSKLIKFELTEVELIKFELREFELIKFELREFELIKFELVKSELTKLKLTRQGVYECRAMLPQFLAPGHGPGTVHSDNNLSAGINPDRLSKFTLGSVDPVTE